MKPNQIEVFDGFIKVLSADDSVLKDDALFFLGDDNKPVSLKDIQTSHSLYGHHDEDTVEAMRLVHEQGGRWLAAIHIALHSDDDSISIAPQDIFRLIPRTPDLYCRDLLLGPERYGAPKLTDVEHKLGTALTSSRYLPAIRLMVENSSHDRFKIPESVAEQIAPLVIAQIEDWRKQRVQVEKQLFSWHCVKLERQGLLRPKTTNFLDKAVSLNSWIQDTDYLLKEPLVSRLVSRMLYDLDIASEHNHKLFLNLLEESADEDEDWDQAPR